MSLSKKNIDDQTRACARSLQASTWKEGVNPTFLAVHSKEMSLELTNEKCRFKVGRCSWRKAGDGIREYRAMYGRAPEPGNECAVFYMENDHGRHWMCELEGRGGFLSGRKRNVGSKGENTKCVEKESNLNGIDGTCPKNSIGGSWVLYHKNTDQENEWSGGDAHLAKGSKFSYADEYTATSSMVRRRSSASICTSRRIKLCMTSSRNGGES